MNQRKFVTCLFHAVVTASLLMLMVTEVSAKAFKIAVGDARGSAQHELGRKFVELFEAKTNGKHTAKLFPNGQLGSERGTVNDAALGTLDFSILAVNNLAPFSELAGYLTLPYFILSLEAAEKITQGGISREIEESTVRDAGVRIIGWAYGGFRVLTNSKRPIKTLQDLQGISVRVPRNDIMIATYKAWGINPTPMAWSETFTALQQRVVDGQDNTYMTIHAMKFYEVQKYVTNIRYNFALEPLVVSEGIFQEMDEETQNAVLEAGREATLHSAEYLRRTEAAIKEDLLARGIQIDDPANGERDWIAPAAQSTEPECDDCPGSGSCTEGWLEFVEEESGCDCPETGSCEP